MGKTLKPGLYGPLPTFFTEDQEIDYVSYKKHLLSTYATRTLQCFQDSESALTRFVSW
jgi:dihydrodipicolinate synthase/N-acetylneuraminate lyase